MTRASEVSHVFVEHIPDVLEDGTLYISIPFATVVHRCCCGCGSEIVTPLTTTDWALTYDGETISLSPSIGNWHLPCQSHYWIERSRVRWARAMSRAQIDAGRAADRSAKAAYYASGVSPARAKSPAAEPLGWRVLLRRIRRWH